MIILYFVVVQLQMFLIYVNRHSLDLPLGLEPLRIRDIVANGAG